MNDIELLSKILRLSNTKYCYSSEELQQSLNEINDLIFKLSTFKRI
jgi:transposase